MERRLNAELWDKMHYLFRDFNDRVVHAEFEYDFTVNPEALKTVIICAFEKMPVLHSSFRDNHVSPYWEVNRYTIEDILTLKKIDESLADEEAEKFLTSQIPADGAVQMKILALYYSGKTRICFIENHMCMDGGDLKFFLKDFCRNYNEYVNNGVSPLDFRTGNRSYTSVYKDLSKTDQKAAQNLYRNINKKDNHAFPLTEKLRDDKSFIARKTFSADTFLKIKSEGKKHGATINDMLMAAYFYSLYELAGFGKNESVSISCAIDLRRHLKSNEDLGYTNHTAWMQCRIPELGRDIFETLQYVIRSANEFKQDKYMGLYGLPLLSLGYKIMPHAASEEIIKIGYANPLLAMSNIGILEVDKLALNGHEPSKGFMTGAVKYKPFVLLSATSLRNELTLSMCVRGNEKDRKIVDEFFNLMEKNINTLITPKNNDFIAEFDLSQLQ